MRLLYYDKWIEAPAPAAMSGCVTVCVSCASTPGQQSDVRASLGRAQQLGGLLSQSGRLVRSTMRHVRTYGIQKTMRSVRSHARHFHLKRLHTWSSVAGVVVDEKFADQSGRLVAGYRHDGPLCADFLTLHPDQLCAIPEGVDARDAATVLYYAMALAAAKRIAAQKASSVVIHGTTMTCRLLRDLAQKAGCEVVITSSDAASMEHAARAIDGGAIFAIGQLTGRDALAKLSGGDRTLYVGIDADQLTPRQWLELEPRWIGLPHSELRNLHIASGVPLEVDAAFQTSGLAQALEHMRSTGARPSSHARIVQLAGECAGQTVDLSMPRLFALANQRPTRLVRLRDVARTSAPKVRVAALGLGSWGTESLFPLVRNHPRAQIVLGIDRNPLQLQYAAGLLGLPAVAADPEEAIASADVDALFISTRHDSHAELAVRALAAGKKVFLEKPLALDYEQLALLTAALRASPRPFLAAGFNRPHWQWTEFLRRKIAETPGPVTISAIVRELKIPRTHYYNWPHMGTRIVSNGCHWIDLAHHLLGGRTPTSVQTVVSDDTPERAQANNVIVIRYADGSSANLVFSDAGDARPLVHEYIDIKTNGSHFMIHDFKSLTELRDGTLHQIWHGVAERGWERCVGLAIDGMLDGALPRPFDELIASTMLTLEARASYQQGGALRMLASGPLGDFERSARGTH